MGTTNAGRPSIAAVARCLAGGAALATGIATAVAAGTGDVTAWVVGGQFLDEGFESPAVFPPAGWTYDPISTFPYDWHATVDPLEVHGGSAAAAIHRQTVYDQHELLITPNLDLQAESGTGLRLSFWYRTDPFWFHGTNTVFRVQASLDGTNWLPLFRADDVTETGWAWRNVVVDLSGWAGTPGLLRVRFTYHGVDAADLALDDVRIGYLEPPNPPANDTCAGAVAGGFTIGPSSGPFQVTGNSFFASHDYPLPSATSCTGYAHDGRDLVWRVLVPAGYAFSVTMTTLGGWDDTLFLITDCGDPAASCVDGDRAFPDGATVGVTQSVGTGTYYLVASGWGEESGEFVLDGTLEPDVSVATSSWGRIKAGYRAPESVR